MNLHRLLQQRAEQGNPVKIGVIGAGKFGSMLLAQVRTTTGFQLVGVTDLDPQRATDALLHVGWPRESLAASSLQDASKHGSVHIGDDAEALISSDIEVLVECTGNPAAGFKHALLAIENGKHVVMVNVEADALAGALLARRAEQAGVVYSLAYGDQPALIAELVDWARASGFDVVAAGKGTKYLPEFHYSTPETVWAYYGLTAEEAAAAGMNSQMFNSFIDGTKSAIEMAAVANATGLDAAPGGLVFPPAGADDLAQVLRPVSEGGMLAREGLVEVVSSLNRDGSEVERHMRWAVYVVVKASSEYVASCFHEYGFRADSTGRYAAMYRPFHLIGLEAGISIASAALRHEPTGSPREFRADAVAVAKKDLAPGEILDGEGGYAVRGVLMPADESIEQHALPIGLAHGVKVTQPMRKDELVTADKVELNTADQAVNVRRAMESTVRQLQASL